MQSAERETQHSVLQTHRPGCQAVSETWMWTLRLKAGSVWWQADIARLFTAADAHLEVKPPELPLDVHQVLVHILWNCQVQLVKSRQHVPQRHRCAFEVPADVDCTERQWVSKPMPWCSWRPARVLFITLAAQRPATDTKSASMAKPV